MSRQGMAHMGIGRGRGEGRVKDAVKSAINSPLLETNVAGAKHILLRISGDENLGMLEFSEAADMIEQEADGDADVRIGMTIDNTLGDEIIITVIATGFDDAAKPSDITITADKGFRPPPSVQQSGFDDIYESDKGTEGDGGSDYREYEPSAEQETLPIDDGEGEGGSNDFAIPGFLRGE
jgi:cell division protein FtsZ